MYALRHSSIVRGPPDPVRKADATSAYEGAGEPPWRDTAFLPLQKAQDPHIDQTLLDRLNIAAGTYAPDVSYYGVGVRDATARRGQDIESSDRHFAPGR